MARTYNAEDRMMKGFDLWLSGAVQELAPGSYQVRSQSNPRELYDVNRDYCSCADHRHFSTQGYLPCKHQFAAAFHVDEKREKREKREQAQKPAAQDKKPQSRRVKGGAYVPVAGLPRRLFVPDGAVRLLEPPDDEDPFQK